MSDPTTSETETTPATSVPEEKDESIDPTIAAEIEAELAALEQEPQNGTAGSKSNEPPEKKVEETTVSEEKDIWRFM